MKLYYVGIPIFLAMLLAYGCDSRKPEILHDDINEKKVLEIRNLITSELQIGSTSNEIEAFFERNRIDFSYDRFAKRYQGIIRGVGDNEKVDQAVIIYIYVDEKNAFKSFEVHDSFTAI